MHKLTCKCGHSEENDDHYLVEGKMWHHALTQHPEMIKEGTGESFAEWLKEADKTMGLCPNCQDKCKCEA